MDILNFVSSILFSLGLFYLLLSWHNLDRAYNILRMEKKFGEDMYELSLSGKPMDDEEIHMVSLTQLLFSSFCFIISYSIQFSRKGGS